MVEAPLVEATEVKPFLRPQGHVCRISTGVHDLLTFGTGTLSDSGFWSEPCYECAQCAPSSSSLDVARVGPTLTSNSKRWDVSDGAQ